MNTCHAFQINSQATTRYQLLRSTNGIEHLRTAHDTTPDALLTRVLADQPDAIYNDEDGNWYKASTMQLLAEPGDTFADFGDYVIAIYTDEEAQDADTINELI